MIDLKKYLKNPDKCPYCGSTDITKGDTDFSYINAWETVVCNECGKEWVEEFTITDVTEE